MLRSQYVIGVISSMQEKSKTLHKKTFINQGETMMDEWTRLTANRVFISDLGENQTTEIDGVKTEIGRFAKGNHNVVEVGSDVVALMHKYDVPAERVLRLLTNGGCHG